MAKKATATTPKTLAANRRRRKARSNPGGTAAAVANPPIAQDLTHVLLPGFAAYAATRVIQRVVFMIVQRKWPRFGKHASALAGVAGFGGVWFFAHKIQRLAKYHDGIVMGSGVAALHGVATCYMPTKYKWLLTDCRPEDVAPKSAQLDAATLQQQARIAAAPAPTADDEFSYLERQLDAASSSGSRRARTIAPPKRSARPVANALQMASHGADDDDLDPDLTSELSDGESVDDLYSGPFSDSN
jgi:hypothetical protein